MADEKNSLTEADGEPGLVPSVASPTRLPLRRRVAYALLVYFAFLLLLAAIEVGTRLTMAHVASLDLFVTTAQQKAQVADTAHGGIFEGDPLLLWRLRPNLDHAIWDFTVLSTNAEHLRSETPSAVLPPRQPGTVRIVCLGDSVTFGYRVPVVWRDKPTVYEREWLPYPMLLEKQLRAANPGRRIEVVNMAVPGYTSHQGLAWLQRDIAKLQPDLLTVSFGWNDASLSDVPDREAIRTNWSSFAVRWLADHSQAFAHATRWLRAREAGTRTGQAGRHPVARVSQPEYVANMLAIVDLALRNNSRVLVIAAPYRDHSAEAPEADAMPQYRASLEATVRGRGVPFLEVRELTEAAYPANQGWFGERIHPNHMGHRLLAAELLKLIKSKQALGQLVVPEIIP